MLTGGPQRTTRHGGYPLLPKRRRGVLVRERVLVCCKGVKWYAR